MNLDCGDPGVFGPPELCQACPSDSDSDCGRVLSCFQCDREYTGDTKRCSSNILFV